MQCKAGICCGEYWNWRLGMPILTMPHQEYVQNVLRLIMSQYPPDGRAMTSEDQVPRG